jgi:hypothetical protein
MNEIYRLHDYDLIDIGFSENMSRLVMLLIWSEYDESRVIIEINELIHVTVKKLSSRGGKNRREFPFFIERIVLSETSYTNETIRQMILPESLGADEITHNLYHLRVECVEMLMEAVGLHVAVHDSHGTIFNATR